MVLGEVAAAIFDGRRDIEIGGKEQRGNAVGGNRQGLADPLQFGIERGPAKLDEIGFPDFDGSVLLCPYMYCGHTLGK